MTEVRKGLSWSRRWHVINEDISAQHAGYDVAICGTYLHNPTKDRGFPEHLRSIIAGQKAALGDCKACARIVGKKTVDQLLGDEDMANMIGKLIYERSQMVQGDADDLAWDIMNLIKEQAK